MVTTDTRIRCRNCYQLAHIRRVVAFTHGVKCGGLKVTCYVKLIGRTHVFTHVLHTGNFRMCSMVYGMTKVTGSSVKVPGRYRGVNTTVYGPVLRTHLLGRTRARLGIIVKLYIKRSDLFCGCSGTCAAALIAGSHIAKRGPTTTLCATGSCCHGGLVPRNRRSGWRP